jgi:mono/diheme cytochrome c family protein
MIKKITGLFLLAGFLMGCGESGIPWETDSETERWYTQMQVAAGSKVYRQYCAACHGRQAEGAPNWVKPDADGFYPPPPLNGTAHAWHHPYPQLVKTIAEGTQGKMPAWKDRLNKDEIASVIAYFQSRWPDRGYELWLQRHKR